MHACTHVEHTMQIPLMPLDGSAPNAGDTIEVLVMVTAMTVTG